VPFRTFTWVDDRLALGSDQPDPELRQTTAREFVLLKSFCFRFEIDGDPDDGTVYVVPGEDDPSRDPAKKERQTTEEPPQPVIVAPTLHAGKTDLASVPWFMWWLIASYGNHTRAALLHDALYADQGEEPPVARSKADRLFLAALREPEQTRPGVFRHWLMWAAVSLFGNMGALRGGVCALHVLAVWVLTFAAISQEWAPALWHSVSWPWWVETLVAVAVIVVFFALLLGILGTFWRAGVDITGGWLAPTLIELLLIVVLIWIVGGWLLVAAFVLAVLGPLWGFYVDPSLRWWLWPTSLIGLPISLLPVVLIFVAVFFVWCIDFGAMVAAWLRRARRFEVPSVKPFRLPV
jgi:hypothetical protein